MNEVEAPVPWKVLMIHDAYVLTSRSVGHWPG
jgi:hypothetical protein